MFQRFLNMFQRKSCEGKSLVVPDLGEFLFSRGNGWRRRILLESRCVELIVGAEGETLDDEMWETAKYWVANWETRREELNDYIESELKAWPADELQFALRSLKIQSIHVLWKDTPQTCMIYFELEPNDSRQFHLTLNATAPVSFAYDD